METQQPVLPSEPIIPPATHKPEVKNSLVLIMSILLIVTVAIAGLFYFQIQKLSKELSKYQIQPSSTPTATADPTADWKTYTNDEYRIEIKYYPESTPYELVGNTETGQFTYLYQVNFGMNPLKSIYGYSLVIRQKQTIENYRTELIGHITDKIDSEEDTTINGNTWKKINYQMFLTTDYVPMTMAYINHSKYDFVVTASALDIDQILSTFKFLETTSQNDKNLTKEECARQGGIWKQWGKLNKEYCQIPVSDGGKLCTDGSQCSLGNCIAKNGTVPGECQTYKATFGCITYVKNGIADKKNTICLD